MTCIPFTYLIGWSFLDLWYYGVRYSQNANPEQLWKEYFTSSAVVQKYRSLYGEPDVIMIRKTFTSVEKARLWEQTVLRRLKVRTNDKWLNQHEGGAPPIMFGPCSDKRKNSISNARLLTEKLKCPFCKTITDPGNYKQFHGENCKHNPDIDPAILANRKDRNKKSAMKSIKNGTHKSGSPISKEPIICPHCNKKGTNLPVMKRFHFERCPKKQDAVLPLHQTSSRCDSVDQHNPYASA